MDLKAIDFFCGGGGMTCGLRQAGINVIAGVDIENNAKETYEYNNPGSVFIKSDIKRLRSDFFERKFGVQKNDDSLVLVGCSPCQFYSIINTDRKESRNTKDLLKSFARFVDYYRPGFVVVENVPGIITNKASIWPYFRDKLAELGYDKCVCKIVDMSYYGVPQTRKRFSLIATRLKDVNIQLPLKDSKQSLLRDFIGPVNGFPSTDAGNIDNTRFNHTVARLSEKCLRRIKQTKHDGGSRFCWANDPDLQLKCFVGKDNSFKDSYGRMWWDRPSPTITTKFYSLSNGRFGHPEEDRALSVREGATLQTFPKDYVFLAKGICSNARLIGNAVPCEYARRLGVELLNSSKNYGRNR